MSRSSSGFFLNASSDDADTFKLDVQSIGVNGDTATARVSSDVNGDKTPATLTLKREAGGWRLAGLGR